MRKHKNFCVRWCAMLIALFISTTLLAQKTVTGTVISGKDNLPVASATVTVKGTKVATSTDPSGKFSISLPDGKSTLAISSVGFADAEVDASSGTVSVTLTESTSSLEEIVVTGYTAQKKKDITGAVAVVNVSNLKAVPSGNSDQLLQGQASGVQVITSGQPGTNSQINIRGVSSFGNNDPLYVIDGVQGSLHDINPNDIESIQVLKDAGATAEYGIRGGAGVIVITTKRGRSGHTAITYDGYVGTQRPLSGNPLHLLNAQEMMQIAQKVGDGTDLYGDDYKIPEYLYSDQVTGVRGTGSAGDAAVDPSKYRFDPAHNADYFIVKTNPAGTDWFHESFKPALQQSHSLSASGGTDKSSYLFSFNYLDQQGTYSNTYLKRYSVRINTTTTVKKIFRVGENAYLFYKQNPQVQNLWEGSSIANIYGALPILPVYDIGGNYAGAYDGPGLGNAGNPVAGQDRAGTSKSNTWDVLGNVFAEVDLIKDLTLRTSFGGSIDNQYNYNFNFTPYESFENHNLTNGFRVNSQYNSQWQWTNLLSYSNTFGDHYVKAFVGSEAINSYGRGLNGQSDGLSPILAADPNYWSLTNGTQNRNSDDYAYSTSTYSVFGRLEYHYKDRYLITGTFRRDGASVLAPDQRYNNFPSVSAGWRISQEEFMQGISWLSDLKLRGSYGISGSIANVPANNAFFTYGQQTQSSYYDINGTSNSSEPGYLQTHIGNSNTRWERDKVTNIGLDASLYKNKLDFTAEYFIKKSDGLLAYGNYPVVGVGFATFPYVNSASIENKGVDFNATYHATVNKDLKIDIGVNFSSYKNKVTSVPNPGYFEVAGSRQGKLVRNMPGEPVGAFYGYEVIGIFQDSNQVKGSPVQPDAAQGRFIFRDVDGNDTINANDRTVIGNPNPDFTYGINLGVTYKNLSLSAFFYGSQGNDNYNEVRYWTDFYGTFPVTKSKDALYNSWTPSNPNAKVPILSTSENQSTANASSSYFIENGSFFKCRYLKLAYNFKPNLLQHMGMNSLSIYVQAVNLFTITKYSGLDPELQSPGSDNGANPSYASNAAFGIDYGNYPNNQKSYLVGVNLSF